MSYSLGKGGHQSPISVPADLKLIPRQVLLGEDEPGNGARFPFHGLNALLFRDEAHILDDGKGVLGPQILEH